MEKTNLVLTKLWVYGSVVDVKSYLRGNVVISREAEIDMIMPNEEQQEEQPQEQPSLEPEDIFKCFYLVIGKLLVNQIKAGDQNPCIAIKTDSIAKVKDDFELIINHNPKEDSFEFRIPYKQLGVKPQKKKRKRGIVTPRRKLFLSG